VAPQTVWWPGRVYSAPPGPLAGLRGGPPVKGEREGEEGEGWCRRGMVRERVEEGEGWGGKGWRRERMGRERVGRGR